jgi:hypothetical protein
MTTATRSVRSQGRPAPGTRRFGYAVACLANLVVLYLIHVAPGWSALPFLTADTEQVLGVVTLAVVASLAANLLFLATDPRWLRALGEVVTTGVGLLALVRVWQVFPFDLPQSPLDVALVVRVVLAVGVVGSVIGIVAQFVAFARAVGSGAGAGGDRS